MAIFGWKKKDDNASPDSGEQSSKGAGDAAPSFDPVKAEKFFDRAAALHEATNYEYAMTLWLGGIRQDPSSMKGMQGFFKSAASLLGENPKGPSKDTFKQFDSRNDLEKYLRSLLDWGAHPIDPTFAIKALENAAALGLSDPSIWIAERALGAVARDKKPKKEQFLQIMKILQRFGRTDMAIQAGEAAIRVDPSDMRLAAEVRNLSAESTMSKGGFDKTGEEGGFRSNIRDAAKQRHMEEADRVVTTEEALDRIVAQARADFETNPLDRSNTIKYLDVLEKRAKPEDEEAALRIAGEAFARTQEYRFRETADRIGVKQLRRKAARFKALAEQPDAAETAKEAYQSAVKEYLKAEIRSLEGQVQAYPTDVTRKFELGQRYFKVGRYEDAIGLFQQAKDDMKNRARVLFFLGLSFQRIGWNDEAIETIRQAISMLSDANDESGLELRYALMEALLSRGTEQRALPDAEEADKIASSIAIQSINYKQIRQRREEIKALLRSLRGGAAPATGSTGA